MVCFSVMIDASLGEQGTIADGILGLELLFLSFDSIVERHLHSRSDSSDDRYRCGKNLLLLKGIQGILSFQFRVVECGCGLFFESGGPRLDPS